MDKIGQIALSMIPGLGAIGCRRLLAAYPGEDIFALPPAELALAFGQQRQVAQAIVGKTTHARAEAELRQAERCGARVLFCTDEGFPRRLNRPETADCPVVLYVLGTADLDAPRTVAVVGTRKATARGCETADRLVEGLKPTGATVVSGLAYGIDSAAHKAALAHGLPTVGVLGHGLDRLYPPENRQLAADMVSSGGALVTEFPSGTAITPGNFPARNRIIAALADATVVVEARSKGGALITAGIAIGYQRELFAVPGRLGDSCSVGTNGLIATQKAHLLRNADDLAAQMGWPMPGMQPQSDAQQQLFPALSPAASQLVDLLRRQGDMGMDRMVTATGMSMSMVAALLFDLEMAQVVRPLPGSVFQLIE